jgi:hypothetical protein
MKKRTLWFAGILFVLMLFPYGPLFPWSPVKPGYDHVALERADVYFASGTTLDSAYRRIDEYIAKSEQFHGLRAPKRICVVACKDWDSFRRFLPHMRGNGVGAVALATGTAIYVSPRLVERGLDTGEFLRHEISHATLHQNQNLVTALRFGKVERLSEGLAVAYGDQKSYYTDAEFLARIKRENVAPFIDPARRAEAGSAFDIRYAYVVWRRFNEHLMTTKGRDAYQKFLEASMQDPEAWRELFPKHLGVSFADAVEEFQGAMRKVPGVD